MNRAPRFTALVKAVAAWTLFALVVLLLAAGPAFSGDCPAAPRVPAVGERCIAEFRVIARDTVERVPVYVVRYKSLEAADLSSWAVPGAVVIPLDGLQRGLQVAVPLSILSECRA